MGAVYFEGFEECGYRGDDKMNLYACLRDDAKKICSDINADWSLHLKVKKYRIITERFSLQVDLTVPGATLTSFKESGASVDAAVTKMLRTLQAHVKRFLRKKSTRAQDLQEQGYDPLL